MRQNFIADNIVKLAIPVESLTANIGLYAPSDNPVNDINSLLFNSSNSGYTIVFDSASDALLSFDYAVNAQAVGASGDVSFVVVTYVAPSQFASVSLRQNYVGYFNPLVVGDNLTCSGRCVVPALPLGDGESQYVALGIIDNSGASIPCVRKQIQARLHKEDIQVFDPLRN